MTGAAILALALLMLWFEARKYMQRFRSKRRRKCCVTDWNRILELTTLEPIERKRGKK
jgi:hypothetical protein